MNIRRLNINRISSGIMPNKYNKRGLTSKNPLRINKNYFRDSNNNKIKEIKEDFNEEEKNDVNTFKKTYNKKPMFKHLKPKDISLNINNRRTSQNFYNNIGIKKLPRNISSHTISKNSTLYKTKNRLLSSMKLENYNNRNRTVTISSKRNSLNPKKGRAFSASMININNKNSLKRNSGMNAINKTLGNGGFITALEPIIAENNKDTNKSNGMSENRSYFLRRIRSEKKFLTYFDIQRILFLERKVYKPDKAFERKVYLLKKNNSDEFITNFNFDKYKIAILRLFQNKVSSQNYDIMKKYFDIINKGWRYKKVSRSRKKKLMRNMDSEIEREIKYNQEKFEKERRLKEKAEQKLKEKNKSQLFW